MDSIRNSCDVFRNNYKVNAMLSLTLFFDFENQKKGSAPVLESPPEPASRNLRLLVACENVYFVTSFKLVGLLAFPSELRQRTWQVPFPILDIIISERELIQGKNLGVIYLGACEVAGSLQARLAGSHGL